MSETETVKACPRGHTHFQRRVKSGVVYCESCRQQGIEPHYDPDELIEKPRRVNDHLDYDVSMGYVWSPSHGEGDA